jgi:hypothetical protein
MRNTTAATAWGLAVRDLGYAVANLGLDEVKLLTIMANRLQMGQDQYGKLRKGKKEWLTELLEELLDASVYLSAELHYSNSKDGKREKRPARKASSDRARNKV